MAIVVIMLFGKNNACSPKFKTLYTYRVAERLLLHKLKIKLVYYCQSCPDLDMIRKSLGSPDDSAILFQGGGACFKVYQVLISCYR